MLKKKALKLLVAGLTGCACVTVAQAGVTVYKDGDKYIKIGGRMQMQYHKEDPDTGSPADETSDEIFFRRLRPYIEGSLHKDWKGKIQWDMGESKDDNELKLKDAYMQYKGIPNTKLTIGNALFPFSRETLTSSKYQQLVERTFVGDHNYGAPDRNLGLHAAGDVAAGKFSYGVSLASASIDPDDEKLDFDTPVNRNADFNDGWMYGGRVDIAPFGKVNFSQGDFDRKFTFSIGLATFVWANDNDNNTKTDTATGLDTSGGSKPDVDIAAGTEVSLAVRGFGFSLDIEQNSFASETVDPAVTSGLYKNGEAKLTSRAVEAGYMVIPSRIEIVAGQEIQDADTYAEVWKRNSVGINWFIQQHDVKIQLTRRTGENLNGVKDNDSTETFLQTQFVF